MDVFSSTSRTCETAHVLFRFMVQITLGFDFLVILMKLFFFRSRDRQISQKGNDGDDKNEQEGLLESYKPTFFDEISRRRRCVLTKFSLKIGK